MNFSAALNPLFSMLWWLVPILLVSAFMRSPRFKGFMGEWLVRLAIRFFLDPQHYRAVHDVTLSTPDGTTQIDHVIFSRYGVFVVETKNYAGWIFGGEHQRIWTQKLYKRTFKFQNPIHQNYKHLKALEALLDIPPAFVHSVIVFVGGSTFKTDMPLSVTTAANFIKHIKSKDETVLSMSDVDKLLARLMSGRMAPTFATAWQHVRNVQNRNEPAAARQCPKCSSPMVLRTAKSGSQAGCTFWGCSQFPKCRTVQNTY